MYSRINYTAVGIFVLVLSIGLVGFAFWLAKYNLVESYDVYKLKMNESVAGLSKDSRVMFRGVTIGRVSEIKINSENIEEIEVYLEIAKGIPIKEDMVAKTRMLGVTGILSVEIEGGSNEAVTLEPKYNYIPEIRTESSLVNTLSTNVTSLSEKMMILLDQANHLLETKNITKLERILENAEKMSQIGINMEYKMINSLERFDNAISDINHSVSDIKSDFKVATEDFELMKNAFLPASQKVKEVTVLLEKTIQKGDYNMRKILEPMIIDIHRVTVQTEEVLFKVQQSPGDLLFQRTIPKKGPGE